MELFIQIRDGQPYEHPIIGGNFRSAFPSIDPDNLPASFARFVRSDPPTVDGVYRVVVGSYVWDQDIVRDNWIIRDMTSEEREAKIEHAKANKPIGDFWLFNEDTCEWYDPELLNTETTIGVSNV